MKSVLAIGFAISLMFGSIAEAADLTASWYSVASLKKEGTWKHGERKMANGKRFDENAFTCATRLYPLGTCLRVVNQKNGREVRVVVTDRIGARFAKKRIDLSLGAFRVIADPKVGLVPVKIEVIHAL